MTTLIIVSIALVLAVVFFMNEYGWTDLTGSTRNDLVFEERNKKYGAYEIRQKYGNRLIVAFFGMMGVMTLAAFSPTLFKGKHIAKPVKPEAITEKVIEIQNPELPKEEVFEQPEQPKQEQKQQRNDISTFDNTKPIASDKPQEKDTAKVDDKAIAGTSTNKGLDTLGNGSLVVVKTGGKTGCLDYDKDKGTDNGGIRGVLEVEEEAKFPGGVLAYLQKNLKYPELAVSAGIEGKVYVEFVVNEDGSTRVSSIRKSDNQLFDIEAKRVIASMKGWKPAKFNDKPVKVRMVQPISFKLQK